MRASDLIRKKRDGGTLGREEIAFFVDGVTSGAVPDYQAAAMLMAIVLRGMTADETAWLTDAMVRSGQRAAFTRIRAPKADKHSTGGVGDKTSLVVAPLAAACGVAVPMMSGRGLGHTGGTLDKLESIPGFRTQLTLGEMEDVVARVGCCITGQTREIAPADRVLYALRDVTATVDSVPLICASIMSKKIAEGIDALVLDVKCGRGAFMETEAEASALAALLVSIGGRYGVRTEALITAMDAPLGRAVGNALEVREAIETLRGGGPPDLVTLSTLLAARMLVLTGTAPDERAATARVGDALATGAALERLRGMIAAQGGDSRVVDDVARLPAAAMRDVVGAPAAGYVAGLDAGAIGRAAVLLGAGREIRDEPVDHAVGLRLLALPGEEVSRGDPVVEIHYNDPARLARARPLVEGAVSITAEHPRPLPVLRRRLAA